MGYQGRSPIVGSYKLIDNLTSQFNSAQTQFSLTSSSQTVIPGSAQNLIISVGGVLQSPGNAYSVMGSTIIFSAAPANTQPFFGVLLGEALDVGYITSGVDINVNRITATGNVSVNGAVTLANTLAVTGATTVANTLVVTGDTTLSNTLAVVGDIYTNAAADYYASSVIVGWSSLTSGRRYIFCKKVGKIVFVDFHLEGTSNSTAVSFTVPYPSKSQYGQFGGVLSLTYDNTLLVSSAPGRCSIDGGGSTTVNCYKDSGVGAWTASGNKIAEASFWYFTD